MKGAIKKQRVNKCKYFFILALILHHAHTHAVKVVIYRKYIQTSQGFDEGARLTARPMDFDWFIAINQLKRAMLTHTVFATERHSVPNWKRFPTERHRHRQ